jgi:hypothetical protein
MTTQETSGIFVASGRTSARIDAALLSLGFSPLTSCD